MDAALAELLVLTHFTPDLNLSPFLCYCVQRMDSLHPNSLNVLGLCDVNSSFLVNFNHLSRACSPQSPTYMQKQLALCVDVNPASVYIS